MVPGGGAPKALLTTGAPHCLSSGSGILAAGASALVLASRYFLMRSGQGGSDERGIIQSHPIDKLNVENGLTPRGIQQVSPDSPRQGTLLAVVLRGSHMECSTDDIFSGERARGVPNARGHTGCSGATSRATSSRGSACPHLGVRGGRSLLRNRPGSRRTTCSCIRCPSSLLLFFRSLRPISVPRLCSLHFSG